MLRHVPPTRSGVGKLFFEKLPIMELTKTAEPANYRFNYCLVYNSVVLLTLWSFVIS